MADFLVTGNHLEHTAWPRFTCEFRPCPDGSWESHNLQWIDNPAAGPLVPGIENDLAHLMRRAGDAWREHREAKSN